MLTALKKIYKVRQLNADKILLCHIITVTGYFVLMVALKFPNSIWLFPRFLGIGHSLAAIIFLWRNMLKDKQLYKYFFVAYCVVTQSFYVGLIEFGKTGISFFIVIYLMNVVIALIFIFKTIDFPVESISLPNPNLKNDPHNNDDT